MAGLSVVTLPDSRRSEETLYLSARRETPGSRDARERATSLRDATSRGRIRPRSGAPARIDTRWLAGWSARVSFCRLRACTQQDRSKSIPSRRWECYLDRGWWLIRRRLGFNLLTRGFDVRRISASKITASTCFPRLAAHASSRSEKERAKGREKEWDRERGWEEEGGRLGEGEREKARSGVDEQTIAVPSKRVCGACARTRFRVATLPDWFPAGRRASIFLLDERQKNDLVVVADACRSLAVHSAPMRTLAPQVRLLSYKTCFSARLIREEGDGWRRRLPAVIK